MQKLSARLVAGLHKRRRLTAIVRDCSMWTLGPFLFMALIRLSVILLFSRRPLIVHFGDPLVAVLSPLCRVTGVPTVVTVHGLDVTYPHPIYQSLLRVSLLGIDRFICISREAQAACQRLGISANHCIIIVPGVDFIETPAQSSKADLARALGIANLGGPVLLTVGRLVPRKGVAWFVANVLPGLAERYPSITYLVVGEGAEFDRIVASAEQAAVRSQVVLAGRLSEETLRLCWKYADVYVMPNIPTEHDVEGFGLVAVEAAAAGLPVVAADLQGIRDAIQHGKNGVLVPPQSSSAFHEAIADLFDYDDERVQFGQRAAAFTRIVYAWETMITRYLEEYDRLAQARVGRVEKKLGQPATGSQALQMNWEHAYQHTRRNLRTRRERIAFFRLPLDARILDYGCGDGLDLQCFHSLGYENVFGIDYSAGLLRDLEGELLVQGNCEQTPFADETFDAVFVNSVLHHLNVDRAVAEARRILKPGGILCLIEPRSGFPRTVLDIVTCSPLGAIVPSRIIRNRRVAVRIEYPEYSSWLRRDRRLLADLRAQGFRILAQRNTLFSILVTSQRIL